MPFCPNCKTEYIDGTQNCDICGNPLIAELPDPETEQAYEGEDSVFLTSVDSGMEAEMLNARLVSCRIPCYMKPHDSHGILRVYMGPSNLGADVYVPSSLLEKAKAAIDQPNEDTGSGAGNGISPEERIPAQPEIETPKKPWSTLLTILVIILVLAAFFTLDGLLDFMRKLFGY